MSLLISYLNLLKVSIFKFKKHSLDLISNSNDVELPSYNSRPPRQNGTRRTMKRQIPVSDSNSAGEKSDLQLLKSFQSTQSAIKNEVYCQITRDLLDEDDFDEVEPSMDGIASPGNLKQSMVANRKYSQSSSSSSGNKASTRLSVSNNTTGAGSDNSSKCLDIVVIISIF